MTEPARRRKVSGGAHPGCRRGGRAFGAARWEHPPRPALRTLILPGGRRRPGGAAGSPEPSAGFPAGGGSVSDHRRWGGGEAATRAAPTRIVGDSEAGWVRALGEPPAWGEPASRRGGSRPAPSRAQEGGREHPRRGRRPPHRPAVERARKLLSATRWTNFSGVLGLRFFLTPWPAQPREEGGGSRCSPPRGGHRRLGEARAPHQAQLPAPPPRSRSLRKLRP